MRIGRVLILLLAAVGLMAAAGCGSRGKSPSVASLGGDHTTTSQGGGLPAGGLSAGGFGAGPGKGSGMHVAMRGSLKFSQCMRAHGVPSFPDPNSNGQISLGSGANPNSPSYQSAQKACRGLLPNGGKATPQQLAKAKQLALAHSACMRAHGVKDFPDPDFSGGGVKLSLGGGGKADLNPNNPTFQRAQKACNNGFGTAAP
jgi:hypothetical protein